MSVFPLGVRLVPRIGADREQPLDRPILVCEGVCRVFTAHRRYNMQSASIGTADVSYDCEECGTTRRWGM